MDRNCKTCEFAMAGNGNLVCAGRGDWYGDLVADCLSVLGDCDCPNYEMSLATCMQQGIKRTIVYYTNPEGTE